MNVLLHVPCSERMWHVNVDLHSLIQSDLTGQASRNDQASILAGHWLIMLHCNMFTVLSSFKRSLVYSCRKHEGVDTRN